jgi:uncharacterized protein involved in exopolysaccharide biosynthesis
MSRDRKPLRLTVAVLLAMVLSLAVGLGTWIAWTRNWYTAKAEVLVRTAAPRLLEDDPEAGSRPLLEEFQKTQSALVRSVPVLEQVLRDSKIAQLETVRSQADARSWLENALRVSFQGEIMTVSLSGGRPQELAAIVNAVVASYMNEVVARDKFARAEQLNVLERSLQGNQHRLEDKRQELEAMTHEAEGGKAAKATALEDEIEVVRETAQHVRRRIEQLRLELKAPDRIIPLGSAPVPTQPDLTKGVIVAAGTGLGTLALALLALRLLRAA